MTKAMISIDSEFQSLIPPLSDDEYQRLEKSILSEGVREPIITWNGTIIDGHNRYSICDEHGIEFKTVEREFASRDAAKIWIIENQFGRRNLSKYDRSVLALQLEPLYAAEAKRRQQLSQGRGVKGSQISDNLNSPTRTDEQLAKLAGTSRDTIRKVKVIEQEAAKGNETAIEARDAVKSGEKSINKAYGEIHPKICTVCGKPILDGDCYAHDQNKHKACASSEIEENRGKRGGRPGKNTKNADHDLLNNVAVFTFELLMTELDASAKKLAAAWAESITINESMGVVLTDQQRDRIDSAVLGLFEAINDTKRG